MPKLSTQLTITQVKNLKPKDKPYFVSDSDNLLLKIMPNGNKFFIYEFRNKLTNKRQRITIGKLGDISLSEAREKRNELKKQLLDGVDISKDESRTTLRAIYAEWIKTKSKINEKHLFWIKRRFEVLLLPKLGDADIKEISRKDVINARASFGGGKTRDHQKGLRGAKRLL